MKSFIALSGLHLKPLIRPLTIAAAFIIGYFSVWAREFTWLIRPLLIMMFYIICLQIKLPELKIRRSHLKILLFNIFVPTGLWGVLFLCGQPVMAQIVFFAAVTPTANAAPVVIKFLGGKPSYVVTSFVLTNIGVSVALLFLLPLVTGRVSWGAFLDVGWNLFIIIVVPVVAALVTRWLFKSAPQYAAKLGGVSFFLWSVTLFIVAASGSYLIANNGELSKGYLWLIGLASLLVCAMNFICGRLIGEPGLKAEAGQSLGQKNNSLTIFLALQFADPLVALGPSFYVLWHNLWNAFQMLIHDHRAAKKD
ncbi:MAG: hypothetical protein GX280_06780 [Lentisphaerae bacterium]|nr:hypothetical protein [Lentisphaerota bacterium]